MIKHSESDNKDIHQISVHTIESAITAFRGFFDSGDAEQLLEITGQVSMGLRFVKSGIDVRNWHTLRKIRQFVEDVDQMKIKPERFQDLVGKYGEEKVCQNVILSLEYMRSRRQASAFAHLFAALVNNEIDWRRFKELQNILEKIDPDALDLDFNGQPPSHRLTSVGLAYIQTVMDGIKVLPNGRLYADFKKIVVDPYVISRKEALND